MRALIVCNGSWPETLLLAEEAAAADLIIGADGGTQFLLDSGIFPDIVTGDLDSFTVPEDLKTPEAFQVIHDPDQETNDLEKALKMARDKGAKNVVLLAATGLRLDHTLKNLSVIMQFDDAFDSILIRDSYHDISVVPKNARYVVSAGTDISLFPLSGKVEGITTQGLKYPLNNEAIENGVRDGSSNTAIDDVVEISYTSGTLLIFINKS